MGIEALLTSQIIGFAEGIDDRVSSLLIAGNGIELTYNDGAGTLTIAASGGGSIGGSTGATDNRILRADGTGGATVQNSAVTIDDSGNISGLGTVNCGAITTSDNLLFNAALKGVRFEGNTCGFYGQYNETYWILNNAEYGRFTTNGIINSTYYGFASSARSSNPDLILIRDAANTLAQRNGTTAQTNRIYRTYTSGSVNHHYAIVTNNGSNGYDVGTVNNGVASYVTRLVNNGTTMIEFAADNSNIILRQRSISFGSANGGEVLLRQRTQFSGVLDVVDYTSQSTYNSIALNQLFVGGASSATTTRIKNTSGTMNFRLGNDSSDCNITAATATLSGLLNVGVYTVATLPAAASNAGAIAQVTDSSVTTNGSAVAGGGANRVIVFSNGSAWDVVVA